MAGSAETMLILSIVTLTMILENKCNAKSVLCTLLSFDQLNVRKQEEKMAIKISQGGTSKYSELRSWKKRHLGNLYKKKINLHHQ